MQTKYVSMLAKLNLSYLDLQKNNCFSAQNSNLMEKGYTQQFSEVTWRENR